MKRIICILILLLGTITTAASAQEKCFSNLEDKLWINGEPRDLNKEGVSARYAVDGPFTYLIQYSDIKLNLKYEYVGLNCNLRTILIPFTYVPKIEIIEFNTFTAEFRKSTSNLFSADEDIAKMANVVKKLQGKEFMAYPQGNFKDVLEWNQSSKDLIKEVNYLQNIFGSMRYWGLPLLKIENGCGSFYNPQDSTAYRDKREFAFFSPVTFNFEENAKPPIVLKLNKTSCKASVLIILSATTQFGSSNLQLEGSAPKIQLSDTSYALKLADVTLSSKKRITTLTCVKGNITKKVTTTNPKCPPGYIKK